ncbi:MAG: iron ABC transporter permease [Bacteroidia bacterium]|nr:iron ABC transporter permease [Bacteroidia bacterium]
MQQVNKTRFYLFGLLFIILIAAFLFDLFIGSANIPLPEIVKILFTHESSRPEWISIINDFRLPKVITAILAGAALSVSGLQMQTVFRNPLAGPDVLGITAGASLGVAVVVLGISSFFSFDTFMLFGNWAIVIAACIGSGLILLLIFAVSLRVRDIITILILGIMFGSATIAIVSILQYFSPAPTLKAFVIWTMGSLGGVTKSQLWILLPCVILGLFTAVLSSKILNALLLGENYAKSLGVNIKTSRFLIFFSTSLLAGSVTAFCGPIGFIGIAVPHVTRMIFKTSHHIYLIWGSILIGSVTMLASDILSLLPGKENALPINSVTALLGIPIVIWIIIKNKKIV